MPKVTVLMPTFNVGPWVKEAVESVLNQTYTDFELLVMDDCSTDDTLAIVQSIRDPRIRIEKNERNLGLSDNLNRGLSLIQTEYVSRMDGDDIAEPTWLEKEVNVLDTHPEIGICSAGFQRFGTSDSIVRFPETPEGCMVGMLFSCSVIVPTFRRSLYSELGLRYRSDAFPAEDYRFWADCMRHTKVYNIQETLFHYRMHATQICSSKQAIQKVKADEVRLYMLEWLNPSFSDAIKNYYLSAFISPEIKTKSQLCKLRDFSDFLVKQNIGHFSEIALRVGFDRHILLSVYMSVIDHFFKDGYSIVKYWRYLISGLAFNTNIKYEAKFFLKSVLRRSV